MRFSESDEDPADPADPPDPADRALDQTLQAVPESVAADKPALDDGTLLAYHRGALPEAEARAVEARLARDPEARALLVELTKPADPELVERLSAAAGRPAPRALHTRLKISAAAIGAAAAAAFAVFTLHPSSRAWPAYALELEGFIAPTRGSTANTSVLGPDSRLTIRLRPDRAIEVSPSLAVWVVSPEGTLQAAPAGRLESNAGAFQWVADARSLFREPGHYVLAVHLATDREHLAEDPGRLLDEARRKEPDIGWWTVPIEYVISAP